MTTPQQTETVENSSSENKNVKTYNKPYQKKATES